PHYRPGEWNTLKVRVEKDKISCYVNGQLVIESTDAELTSGQVGLAKFRETKAEFKNFQLGKQILTPQLSADLVKRIAKSVEALSPHEGLKPELIGPLLPEAAASMGALRERAKQLEQQAAQLRQLALAVHHESVHAELTKALRGQEEDIDLLRAALL